MTKTRVLESGASWSSSLARPGSRGDATGARYLCLYQKPPTLKSVD